MTLINMTLVQELCALPDIYIQIYILLYSPYLCDSFTLCLVLNGAVVHIGALQCANCFHSQNRHTVLSWSDSRDPSNLGMLAGVVVWLISASDMADADKCCGWRRPVFRPVYLMTQASIFADTGQWYCWSCGRCRPEFFANTGQWYCWSCGQHRTLFLMWCGRRRPEFLLTQASDIAAVVANTGQYI